MKRISIKRFVPYISLMSLFILLTRCEMDPAIEEVTEGPVYDPTPYAAPHTMGIPPLPVFANNPLTAKGVELGRHLFYDPILSADSTLSCAGCHSVNHAFSDTVAFSIGIDGLPGKRNAMPLFNLGYSPFDNGFFWDGRAITIEEQALMPIQDPLEMHEILPNVLIKLNRSAYYPDMFYVAFGEEAITTEQVANALAQFLKSITTGGSEFDRAMAGEIFLNDTATYGFTLFNDLEGGDCFHCHGVNAGLFTDYTYRNNGIDTAVYYTDFTDPGLGAITGDTADYGKFKVPSLRNIELTAPYMHDGRFQTLEEVLDFYSTGVHNTAFTDNLMQFKFQNGVQLTEDEKKAIIRFLKSLTDPAFKDNPAYQNPW